MARYRDTRHRSATSSDGTPPSLWVPLCNYEFLEEGAGKRNIGCGKNRLNSIFNFQRAIMMQIV